MSDNPYVTTVQPQTTSTWAIVSLLGGIASFIFIPFIGSLVAIISGYIAKKEIRQSQGLVGGDGLATAGLILGWINVVLALLICVLIVLMLTGVIGSIAICGPFTEWIQSIN